MPAKNRDLHGNVPDDAPVALVLIDVINDLEFDGGDLLLEQALPMAERLAELKRRAVAAGVPVIYANDNFGRWRSAQSAQLDHCLQDGVRGEPVVRLLRPDVDDYYVVKPKHSAFFGTTLDVLLDYMGCRTLVLAGLTGDRCVLFTANDAFMRDFHLVIPRDCVASIDPRENEYALRLMQRVLEVNVLPSEEIGF
ncbi:MAG: Isochorismatase [Cyanobacteria bacterium RYN_339]|nr:Isochorismatase [Cyanobacteria bacterium RYN_339]